MRNKIWNNQGRSPNVVTVVFSYHKELLLKERIRSLWEQILSFKRSSHFEKGWYLKRISAWSSSLPLWCVTFSAFWLRHWRYVNVAFLVIFTCFKTTLVMFANTCATVYVLKVLFLFSHKIWNSLRFMPASKLSALGLSNLCCFYDVFKNLEFT